MSTEYTFENKRDPQGSILNNASLGTLTTFLGPGCIFKVSSWKPLRYRIAAAELPTSCHTKCCSSHKQGHANHAHFHCADKILLIMTQSLVNKTAVTHITLQGKH